MTKSIQSIDQEDERRRLSAILLKELVEEFRANGIKVSSTKDSITINGVRFELMDTPSDVHNEVIYIVSPDNQSIPVRKENYGEAIDVIMDYIETQGVGESMEKSFENGRGYDMQPIEDVLTHYADSFDPSAFMDDVRQQMVELDERPEYKRVKEMIDRWNTTESRSDTAIRGHMDDADEIRQPIRDWYTSAYPTDDLGHSMSDITFDDLYSGLSSGLDVYDKIGVGDSIVRERLFDRLAEIKRVSYNDIYNLWLNNARKGVRKSGKGLKKYVEGTIPLPDPIVLNADGKVYNISSDPTYVGNASIRRAQIKMDDIIIIVDIRSMEPYFTFDYEVGAYYNNGWGTKLDNVAPYYGFNIPIEEGIATDFREISDALDHVIQDYRMQAISGYYPDSDITRGMMKSKKLSKNSIDAMVDRIAFACQCDNPIVREINGDTILMMDVHDSDCEYYIEEYGIYQDEVDGKTYNCVNLSRLSKGVRKHRMLSKNIDGVRKSSIVTVRSASISNFTLNGEIVDVFLTDDGVYVGLSSNYDNHGHYDNSDNSLLYVSSLKNTFGALYGSGWVDTYEEMTESYNTFASPEEVNRVRDYLARLGYQEQRIQTFGDGKGWDDYRASTKKSKSTRKSVQSFSTVLDSIRKGGLIRKGYTLEAERYDDNSLRPKWFDTDKIYYVMYQDGYRYDSSGGVPLYDGSWDRGFENFDDAVEYMKEYYQRNKRDGVRASDLSIVEVNGTIYGSDDARDFYPEAYEGEKWRYSSATRLKRASMSKAQLPDDYPNHSEGTFVVHRKVNNESMYPQRFDNREDYESFCRELENKGWTRGREYVDNDGAEVTYFRDTD